LSFNAQVAWDLPLSTVQAQASQAYRFKESLTERVSLEMIAIPGGQLDLARSEEVSALDGQPWLRHPALNFGGSDFSWAVTPSPKLSGGL
jgi:hypothetical protein